MDETKLIAWIEKGLDDPLEAPISRWLLDRLRRKKIVGNYIRLLLTEAERGKFK